MENFADISEKERRRREKISKKMKVIFEKRRKKGYLKWLKKKKEEIAKRERQKQREKEKKKKERERQKHKRPVGRPKKKPIRKSKKKAEKNPVYKKVRGNNRFKIISCCNMKQIGYVGAYDTIELAYIKYNQLKEENSGIIFPKEINMSNKKKNILYEYLLLEKNNDGTKENTCDRNEFGVLIEQKTTDEKWVIRDKFQFFVEETFWVWGYNPRTERKTFMWIYENIINNINTYIDLKRIILFKNKIFIKNDDEAYDIIICKTKDDSIRFYNLLQDYLKGNKHFCFLGSYDKITDKRKKLEEEIIRQTGWTRKKFGMSATKYFLK